MNPGATAFTRTPLPANSLASVDVLKITRDGFGHPFHCRQRGDVTIVRLRLDSQFADLPRRFFGGFVLDINDGDVGAPLRHLEGDLPPNPAPGAGHKGRLPI
jgi:hypothetical protein